MIHVLVSACLLGENCKYNGGNNYHSGLNEFLTNNADKLKAIPVCPEVMGGLPTPRKPAEIKGKFVINRAGKDVTTYFMDGAERTLALALKHDCQYAVLKQRSPSCGSSHIYDGSFQGIVTEGMGMTAALLRRSGIIIRDEDDFETIDLSE